MRKLLLILLMGMFLISSISALENYPNAKLGETKSICQSCASATYIYFNKVITPNDTINLNYNLSVVNGTACFDYTFKQVGRYDFIGYSDACEKDFIFTLDVNNTNLWLLIIIYSLAVIFLLCTLFVNEEFFVYISGTLFLIGGIYTMINGVDLAYDWASRSLSFISIGIGLLFTLGAYIYNSYTDEREEED